VAALDLVLLAESTDRGRTLVREWTNPHPERPLRELVFVPTPALLEIGARIVAVTAAVAP
jgi:hypothetical protein